jgi:endonuclease/exonuclease/phosphatase family metal-dependent hydrolase
MLEEPFWRHYIYGRLAQLARAIRLHRKGRGFKSLIAHRHQKQRSALFLFITKKQLDLPRPHSKHYNTPMRILNLNCQKGLHKNLNPFLNRVLDDTRHKIFLLQEATNDITRKIKQHPSYQIVSHKDDTNDAHVCIAHAKDIRCLESEYHTLDEDDKLFGFLIAALRTKKHDIITASVHLPAYIQPKKRGEALAQFKLVLKRFTKTHPKADRVLIAGDFNTILPWEHGRNVLTLRPHLFPVRNKRGYTYQSDRLEPDNLSSSLVYGLGKIGISFKSTLDHVFASRSLTQKKRIKAYVLNKEVSDHLPIVIVMR